MFSRGLAFCLVLGFTTMAHAGAVVRLGNFRTESVPNSGNFDTVDNGPYDQGQFVQVDVFLSQSPAGTARELRHVQLDFSASDFARINPTVVGMTPVPLPVTHDLATDIRFWIFDSEPSCPTPTTATCGAGHFFDFQFTSPADRKEVVSMTYYFQDASNLKANPNVQRTLPASAEILIGRFRVQMPMQNGCYTLDALNAAQTNPDLGGADIRFGFGTDVTPDATALTIWRANLAAPNNITGNSVEMAVGAGQNCGVPPPCTINLASSSPNDQGSLWRTERNIFFLSFSAALPGLPPAGALKIEKITGGTTPNCTFSADLSPQFTMTLTNAVPPAAPGVANSVLQVRETPTTGGPLEHRAWYRVSYTGTNWTGVCAFNREFVVQVGDADANRFVTAVDVGQVNASPTGVTLINSRVDIDGNGFRTALDVGLANASQGALPPKPCDP